LEDPSTDAKLPKRILQEIGHEDVNVFMWMMIGPEEGPCEGADEGNEPLGSTEGIGLHV
jgi:hypothetical protein